MDTKAHIICFSFILGGSPASSARLPLTLEMANGGACRSRSDRPQLGQLGHVLVSTRREKKLKVVMAVEAIELVDRHGVSLE